MNNAAYYRSEQVEVIHLADRPNYYREHNHVSNYTIGLVLAGNVTLHCEGHVTVYPANSYFVVRPYEMHALKLPKRYSLLSICIHKELVASNSMTQIFDLLLNILVPIIPELDYSLLACALEEVCNAAPIPLSDSQVLDSALAVWRNPENEFRVQNMADEIFYSKYHYIKVFKQTIGMTPHRFQLQNRVRKAQRFIENGMPSTEVAVALGFYDQSHFIKCFKSIVGLTPSEYRQSCKRIN